MSVLVGFLLAVFTGLYQVVIGQEYGGAYPWYVPLAVGAAGTAAAVFVGWRTETPWPVAIYRATCWMLAAGWATAAGLLGEDWLFALLMTWVVGAIFLCGISVVFRYRLPAGNTVLVGEVLPARPKTLADQVQDAIAEASGVKPEKLPKVVLDGEWTPRDAGATFRVTGVKGTAFGPRRLRELQLDIAEILELPDGCPVQVRPGGHQNQSLLDVSLRNYLLEQIMYERDYSVIDIRQPFSIGVNVDSSPTMIELYQAAGLIVGQRGGGKTSLLHLLTLMIGRAYNALVWHIDLNNGGMSATWLQQFARGEVKYPVVDWAAGDLDEAIIMLEVARDIMLFRKQGLAGRLAARNLTKLDVDAEFPEIIIIVDEAAQVLGDRGGKKQQRITELIQDIQQMGRAMCIQVFLSLLRGTGDMMPSDLKKGTALAMATKVKDDDELAFVFGWAAGLKSSNLVTAGMMFVEAMERPAAISKIKYVDPEIIYEATLALQAIRSRVGLRELELHIANTRYTNRWTRPTQAKMLEILAAGEDQEAILRAMTGTHIQLPTQPKDDNAYNGDQGDNNGDDDALAEFHRQIAAAKAAAPQKTPVLEADEPTATPAVGTPVDQLTAEDIDRMVAAMQQWPEAAEPAGVPSAPTVGEMPPLDEPDDQSVDGRSRKKQRRIAFLLDLLRDAGDAGMATGDLNAKIVQAGFSNRENQASDDLTHMLKLGMVTKTPPGGGKEATGRWWAAV